MHGIDPSPVDREHAPVVAEHASFVAHKAKLGQVDLLEPNPNPPSDPSPNPNSNPNPNPIPSPNLGGPARAATARRRLVHDSSNLLLPISHTHTYWPYLLLVYSL